MEGAAAAGAKLVAVENLYMYGPTGGRTLTRTAPSRQHPQGRGPSQDVPGAHGGRRKRQGAGGHRTSIGLLRAARARVGRRRAGFRPRRKQGKAQVAGDPDQPHTYTYAPDIGKGLVVLGEHEEALGRAWHLPAPRPSRHASSWR